MNLLQLKDLLSNSGWGLIILLTLIQIAPIKINPWNSVLKFLGRLMNAELNEKMDGFKRDLSSVKEDIGGMKRYVATLHSDVALVKTDVNTMKNDINGIGGKVDKLRNIVDENEAKHTDCNKCFILSYDVINFQKNHKSNCKTTNNFPYNQRELGKR